MLTPEQARMQRVEKARLENEARRADYDASAGTIVPPEFTFIETQYEPPADGVAPKELSQLSQDDLLTGLAKQYRKTRVSFGYAGRDVTTLVAFVDYITDTYKDERVSGKNRNGKPTVKEVFLAIGWNYEAARKMRQRYHTAKRALEIPDYAQAPKPKQLSDGITVQQEGDDTQYVVLGKPQPGEVEIVPEGASSLADAKIVSAEVVSRVSVKKIKANDLIRDEKGNEYRYVGGGVLKRVNTPAIAVKRDQEVAKIAKAREDRAKAAVEEQKRKAELRKAEDTRRDLERIAEAKTKQEAEAKQKAEKEAQKRAENEAKKAEAKAKKEAAMNDPKKQAEVEAQQKAKAATAAATDAVGVPHGYGVDGSGKSVSIGKETVQ